MEELRAELDSFVKFYFAFQYQQFLCKVLWDRTPDSFSKLISLSSS